MNKLFFLLMLVAAPVLAGYASAQDEINSAGTHASTVNTTTQIENRENSHNEGNGDEDALFLERSSELVRGTYLHQAISFSANRISEKIQICFALHEKIFLFNYDSIDLNGKKLNTIQLVSDSRERSMKTSNDDDLLILLFRELHNDLNQLESLENGILMSLDLLINMVPTDEPFDKITIGDRNHGDEREPQVYTTICNQRGRPRTGTFDGDEGDNHTQQKIVGNPGRACLGRCGTGCLQPSQYRKRQYTGECFDHDLCAGFYGEILGNCADEFAAAADGYINATNCSFYVIGKWQLNYDWGCDGSNRSATITYYKNYTFSVSDGSKGTWKLNNNQILFTYANGTQYTGTIAASNLESKGTMVGFHGRTGCFSETYTTTSTR